MKKLILQTTVMEQQDNGERTTVVVLPEKTLDPQNIISDPSNFEMDMLNHGQNIRSRVMKYVQEQQKK